MLASHLNKLLNIALAFPGMLILFFASNGTLHLPERLYWKGIDTIVLPSLLRES